jgi:hypothetical protein
MSGWEAQPPEDREVLPLDNSGALADTFVKVWTSFRGWLTGLVLSEGYEGNYGEMQRHPEMRKGEGPLDPEMDQFVQETPGAAGALWLLGVGALEAGEAPSGALGSRPSGAPIRYNGVQVGTPLGEAEIEVIGQRLATKGLRLGAPLEAEGDVGGVFHHLTGEVRLRAGATRYDALHELLHVQQWEEIGPEAYGKLQNWEREQYVYDQLTQMPEWETMLTEEERLHAAWYVEFSGGMR